MPETNALFLWPYGSPPKTECRVKDSFSWLGYSWKGIDYGTQCWRLQNKDWEKVERVAARSFFSDFHKFPVMALKRLHLQRPDQKYTIEKMHFFAPFHQIFKDHCFQQRHMLVQEAKSSNIANARVLFAADWLIAAGLSNDVWAYFRKLCSRFFQQVYLNEDLHDQHENMDTFFMV